jgi:hypothetical protein
VAKKKEEVDTHELPFNSLTLANIPILGLLQSQCSFLRWLFFQATFGLKMVLTI